MVRDGAGAPPHHEGPRKIAISIGRRLAGALRLGGFAPPGQIVGKARERALKRLAALPDRLARLRQRLRDRADGDRARYPPHAPLRQRAVPCGRGAGTGEAAGGIARARRRAPEPFYEEVVGEVLQAPLTAPIVFAGDEHETVGAADL